MARVVYSYSERSFHMAPLMHTSQLSVIHFSVPVFSLPRYGEKLKNSRPPGSRKILERFVDLKK
jgi:hypothetical protein